MSDDQTTYENELRTYPVEPLGVTRNAGAWPAPRHRFSLVACARWEAPYIAEWLNYHRSIGFEHAYIYCNDDDPSELYEALLPFIQGADPFVTFHHYSFQGLQFQIYLHFMRNHGTETEWFSFLDIDEFYCVRGSNDIAALVDRFTPAVDAIYFNWCHYGHNGHQTRPAGSVLKNYTRREIGVTPFTKMLIRSRSFPYANYVTWNDGPIQHDVTHLTRDLTLRNVINEDYGLYYQNFPTDAWAFLNADNRRQRLLDVAYVAHFNIKSEEDFDIRVRRGLRGDYAAEATWGQRSAAERAYHHEQTNAVEDTYLHDYWRDYLARSWRRSVFPRSEWALLSETGAVASQETTAHPRSAAEDAQSLLSGRLTGRSQNHTDLQHNPYWAIDFGRTVRVYEVRLFNRIDGVLERMAHFRIESAMTGEGWHLRYEKTDDSLFGGADGTPFRWIDPAGFTARYIRIVVPGENRFLHLDQVQIYGTET
ncbi:glycosyltransferase family 2 protein [Tanticharoenia sakaeratensis]|uniref:F5/8 type C domain-containing protein n=1 Tax=Tanticharoenia sakaeratensis NBRC 103193 TaxID=1231623 RepID=A0A0D6MHF7_9PROT|nr:glycosyltransferase family 2 protein [Tanticharoenia sakaeratensis]GAN53062.1 hypothetical protein Tasa_004_127 [Tanticharoenia sakaeratensis NBRC 103193]GBQ19630.1 hypothetical protein AA103193_1096 [Tanticharoenia sakaeratensis NBRC 103193]